MNSPSTTLNLSFVHNFSLFALIVYRAFLIVLGRQSQGYKFVSVSIIRLQSLKTKFIDYKPLRSLSFWFVSHHVKIKYLNTVRNTFLNVCHRSLVIALGDAV